MILGWTLAGALVSSLATFLDNLSSDQLADRLDLAMEGASLGIWDWDLRDNSVQFDRRWCEMLGLQHEDVPMELSSWESRVHPDDIAQCYADIQAYLKGETPFYQNIHRMRHADGRWVYILDRGRVSGWDEQGEAIRFTGTHFDCTATEEARRVLEQQQELLGSLVSGLPAAVALLDRQGAVLAASDEWDAWFSEHHVPAAAASPLAHPAPPEWRAAHDDVLAGRETLPAETRVETGLSGATRVLRWSMRPWGVDTDAPRGVLLAFEDVTAELEVRARNAQTARLSALGSMAGGIAHELNTPLQSLMLDATVTLEELHDDEPDLEATRELVEQLIGTVNYLCEVVGGMRTLSRDAARDPLQDVPIRKIVRQVRQLSAARLQGRGVRVEVAEIDPSWSVRARPSELSQILVNLLANAADAVEGEDPAWIRIQANRDDRALVVEVVDSGPGVPPELRERIMAPFFTTKPPGEGTGIGLSLSRSLAEKMGASLSLVNDEPHTTFRLRFPDEEGS